MALPAEDVPFDGDDVIQDYIERFSNWGRWGEDDELGTLNELSADRVVAATRLVSSGETVTLTGSGLRPDTQVLFGGTPATGVTVNPAGTQLTALTPAHPAGPVDVAVSTPGGSAPARSSWTRPRRGGCSPGSATTSRR